MARRAKGWNFMGVQSVAVRVLARQGQGWEGSLWMEWDRTLTLALGKLGGRDVLELFL